MVSVAQVLAATAAVAFTVLYFTHTFAHPKILENLGKCTKRRCGHPRRAEHAFSPPLSLGKVEGTAIIFPLFVISALDMHFPLS